MVVSKCKITGRIDQRQMLLRKDLDHLKVMQNPAHQNQMSEFLHTQSLS